MLTRFHQPHHRGEDRRHAGGEGHAALRAFERGEPRLHHLHGGIGETRVDRPGLLALETRRGFGGTAEDEAGGEEHRLRMLVELAAYAAGADRQGVDVVMFVHVSGSPRG